MTRSLEKFILEMKEINSNIEILGTYTKAVERVQVKCKTCGKIWNPLAYSLLQGKGCPSCSAKKGAINNSGKTGLKTTERFIEDLKVVDDSIELHGEYINGHTNIKLHCSRCGNDWEAKPYSILAGHGCPRCAKSGTSFMEQAILLCFQSVLGSDKVLSRDKKTIGMEIDILIPSLKFAIEPGNWWLHKKSIQRDMQKRVLCSEKGIRLITIYDKFPKGQTAPFENDVYTFVEDLNIANHSIIRSLIQKLFSEVGLNEKIDDEEWDQIEKNAYSNAKSMTHEIFARRMSVVNPSIAILGTYQNANRRLLVRCKQCGFEWDAVPANLLSGDSCRKCGTKLAHVSFVNNQEEFEQKIAIVNPNVEIIGNYTGRHSPVKARCRICGYEWEPIASSLLRGSSHKGSRSLHKI